MCLCSLNLSECTSSSSTWPAASVDLSGNWPPMTRTGIAPSTSRARYGAADTRAVGFPGLLIAAVAEREHVTLLHYDSDYDLIAQITTQPMQWVVPRGTVP